ncbi:MAG: inositol monophosphatase family protein [Neisseriaceae bacterium]|nr:inositol monophosphatase family protein [Neisseriaceae bacterium]
METLQRIQHLIRQTTAEEIMPRFLRVGASTKADGTLMTEADLSAQQALMTGLKQIIDCPALGEEMSSDEQRHLWYNNPDGLWVIDPIDGTTNFVAGIPHFAVSVAFVKNGESQMGVTFDPFCDEMFYAVKGQGAFLNGTPLPLRQNACHSLRDAVAAVEVKYLRSGTLAHRMQNLSPCRSQRNMGCSTLDWCYLASGRFDVFLHGGQKLWDYAAGSLIATEAGGQLATLEGDDFWSGKHTFKRSVIAAIEPKLFTAWLKWVRDNQ